MSNNNPNQIDITQLSGVPNTNKLNITGISTFSNITNINNLPNTNNGSVDINNIDINKNYSQCESTLEFFIISLSKNLNINPKQSVALLSNNPLKFNIIANGTPALNNFSSIACLLLNGGLLTTASNSEKS